MRTVYYRSPLPVWSSTTEAANRYAQTIEQRIRELRAESDVDSREKPWRTFDPPLDETEPPRRPLPIGYVDGAAKRGSQHRTKDARGRYATKRQEGL